MRAGYLRGGAGAEKRATVDVEKDLQIGDQLEQSLLNDAHLILACARWRQSGKQ